MTSVIVKDKLKEVVKSINSLVSQVVLVGIPEVDDARREDDESGKVKISKGIVSGGSETQINNATLGYIHEHGSPANNIPARPFLVPGVQSAQTKIESRLKKAANAALDGNFGNVDNELNGAGMVARDSVKTKINSGDFVPLAESTLKARARRGRKGAEEELANRLAGGNPSNDSAKPLIDTGQLRNSINYVIRKAN